MLKRWLFISAVSALLLTGSAFGQEASPADLSETALELGAGGLDATIVQLFLVITLLSLAPGIAMMVTCLPFMVIVFSFMRQAIGLQQTPPNMMIMALAMFLTFFVMEPTFMQAWSGGVEPYLAGEIDEASAWAATSGPFREFMLNRTDPATMMSLANALERSIDPVEGPSFALLSTSFMLSEIKTAFQIGFVIFLPFMVIDLVVASVLMAKGMMMVPPTVVSLPFKLGFFVLADAWLQITEAVLRGYAF